MILLQEAIKALQINDIYQRSSNTSLADDFDPKLTPEALDELTLQHKHRVRTLEVLEAKSEEDQEKFNIVRIFIEIGIRWVSSSKKEDKNFEKARIETIFVAEYILKKEVSQEALEEFAFKNASYHIWPYWREYVMNQAMRMEFPAIVIPVVQFPLKREKHVKKTHDSRKKISSKKKSKR